MNESFPPSDSPDLITRMPSADELAASRMDPRLNHNLTRGALQAMADGDPESAQTLNARYPSPERKEMPATIAETGKQADIPEPRDVPEHEQTKSPAELKELREQSMFQDYLGFAEGILDAHLSDSDPERTLAGFMDTFLRNNAHKLSQEDIARLSDKRTELVRRINQREE